MPSPTWPSSGSPGFLAGLRWHEGCNPNLPHCQMMWLRKVTERRLGVFPAWLMSFWGQLFIFSESNLWEPGTPPCTMNTALGSGLQAWPNLSREVLDPGHIRRQGRLSESFALFVNKMTQGRQRPGGGEEDEKASALLLSHLLATPPFLYKVGSRQKGSSLILIMLFFPLYSFKIVFNF